MKLDEAKLQEVVEKIAYQQFGQEQIDDLYAKMGMLNEYVQEQLRLFAVSGSLTPFGESIKLLRELADLQNGAPLEQHRKEWEETMEQVYDFLNRWEGQ